MGAYYHAALKYLEGKRFYRYSCWKMGNGAKLLEHSYLLNNYVNAIVKLIYFRPAQVVWLCDYHEEKGLNWNEIPELKQWKPKIEHPLYLCLIVNLDKKEYINVQKIVDLITEDVLKFNFIYGEIGEIQSTNEVYVEVYHHLPFLTNSSKEYMGGGDYSGNYKYRAHWKCNLLVSLPLECEPELRSRKFQDVTKDSLVPIKSTHKTGDSYRAFLLLRKLMKQTGTESIKSAVKAYFEKEACKLRASRKKISEFFAKQIDPNYPDPLPARTQLQLNWPQHQSETPLGLR